MKTTLDPLLIISSHLSKFNFPKSTSKSMAYAAYGLMKARWPKIRRIAAHLPLPILKQSKVNRVWRLLRKNKRFSSLSFWHAPSNLIFQLTADRFGSSSPLFPSAEDRSHFTDIDEMKYPSQNEFILECLSQLIQILPFKPVFVGDREFGCERFIRFLLDQNIGFIFRLPRGRKVEKEGKEVKVEDLPNGSHVVSWKGMKLRVCIKQKKDDPRRSFQMAKVYLLRMQQEQTHRELKSRFGMLDLNLQSYFRDRYDVELIQRMIAIMIMGLLSSLWIGYLLKERHPQFCRLIVSSDDELSFVGVGLLFLVSDLPLLQKWRERIIRSICSSLKRRLSK